ncbi:unnamed protein product [Lymnaea stagnalis]|uniref:Acyl-ACP thioesterase n=1 Tax=Lymnaea stagnalis TaxID=6523 RepID=A0AAV2INM1_LYMST
MATQVLDYRLDIDEKNFKAESYFPGIAYDDYDREGGISPWKICRMFEAGRVVPFLQGNFLDYLNLCSKNFGIFVLGGDYYFDSCLWEVTRRYHYFPYKISIELINVGQTSMTIREVLTNLLDNKEIATFYGTVVYVDKLAKRSQPLPYWHRTKYQGAASSEKVQLDSSVTKAPDKAFKVKTLIAASDTDLNGHTNQASYVRFCLDAAEAARRANHLKLLTRDICRYPILKLSTSYRRETLAGEAITTSVWQDDTTPTVIHFALHCGDTLAFTACVTFKPKACSRL